MDGFLFLKTIHLVSATILFGTGIGTAFHLYATHLRGNTVAISLTARNVVLADWILTTPAMIIQPASGIPLAVLAGYDLLSSWLVLTYTLYTLAGGCWVYVVRLQIRIANLARAAAISDTRLPPAYHQAMRLWFWLGWPALFAYLVIFWLMTARPNLW